MTRYFTSDLHLGHERLAQSWRHWGSAHTMNSYIVDKINEYVNEDDELWMLGDLVMGKIAETLPLIKQINGHKTLVVGNHDRMFIPACSSKGGVLNRDKLTRWENEYREVAGIEIIEHGWISDRIDGTDVIVSHFPYTGDHQDEDRFPDLRPVDRGGWLIHGHTHGLWRQRDRMIDVGWDAWNRPVHEDELAQLINNGPNNLGKLT